MEKTPIAKATEYLASVIQPLCRKDVWIDGIMDARGIFLTVRADREDMGSLIGKSGVVAQSVRALLRQFGGKNEMRISMIIAEPETTESN